LLGSASQPVTPPNIGSDRTSHDGTALPEALRETLAGLARRGQASALRDCLEKALIDYPDHPQHTAQLRHLQMLATRFDFHAMTRLLRENDYDPSA
jgi:hypothetical protein